MVSITIRNLDDVKARLLVRASTDDHSTVLANFNRQTRRIIVRTYVKHL